MALRAILILLAGLIATVYLLSLWRAEARRVAIEAAFPPEGQILDVDGVPVHAVVMGEGPDLVLIHGAGGNVRDFTQGFAQGLADRYRVIVFDRPGLGYTGRTDPAYTRAFTARAESAAEQAALLQAAAAQLGADKPIVLGHSYGGAVALAWAVYHPENIAAVVNVGGVAMPWPGTLGAFYTVNGSTFGGALLAPLVAAWAPESRIEGAIPSIFAPNPVPEGYTENVGAQLLVRKDSFRANARQVNSLRPHVVEQANHYPGLTLPIELVHGAADDTVPLAIHAEPLSTIAQDANLTVLDGVGHMPHHADRQSIYAAIDRAAERAGLR